MVGTKVSVIPKIRKVYYTTYANLPTTGLTIGDLGYATDRKVLYEWDGSAWQPITIYSGSGTAASIPDAANLPDGSIYYETDTYKTKQVQSGAWVAIVDPTSFGMSSASGNYTGDGTTNRAIAHGLGTKPLFVLIWNNTDESRITILDSLDTVEGYLDETTADSVTVTAMDATNFYVGGGSGQRANINAKAYYWVAIG